MEYVYQLYELHAKDPKISSTRSILFLFLHSILHGKSQDESESGNHDHGWDKEDLCLCSSFFP